MVAKRFITKGRGLGRKVIPISDKTGSKRSISVMAPKYTVLQKAILDLMNEDTGSNMLDSGGAYGRHYERNQKIKDWNKVQAVTFNESGITKNVFHYLNEFLDITPESMKLQKRFDKVIATSDELYLSDMEQFLDVLDKKGELESDDYIIPDKPEVVNTYNGESLLSQVLQYVIFYKDGRYYIILQVHNGCDVRGGYTRPKIFALDEADSFMLRHTAATVKTKKSVYNTDDAYNFYPDYRISGKPKHWEDLYAEGVIDVW